MWSEHFHQNMLLWVLEKGILTSVYMSERGDNIYVIHRDSEAGMGAFL